MAKTTATPASKKPARKGAKDKGTAAVKAASAKPSRNSQQLRKPQVRVLEALAKAKHPITRKEISEKGNVDLAMLNSYIGSHDKAIRETNDARNFPSLLTLGFIKVTTTSGDREEGNKAISYALTAAGKKAMAAK